VISRAAQAAFELRHGAGPVIGDVIGRVGDHPGHRDVGWIVTELGADCSSARAAALLLDA